MARVMIAVVDYSAGNLHSVNNALNRLGADLEFCDKPETIAKAEKVILPGVGHARAAMASLDAAGLLRPLRELTVPVLGICLGMQLLFERSEEDDTLCLGVLPGTVRQFDNSRVKVPHMGWNSVDLPAGSLSALFSGIPNGSYFYFAHSFYVPLSDQYSAGVTHHGIEFAAAVCRAHFLGVQFHPELSADYGLAVLRNFVERT